MSENNAAVPPDETMGLKAAQAGRLLGIAQSTLFKMQKVDQFGPARLKLGRAVRYDRREVLDWMRAGCPPAAKWRAMRR